MDAPGVPHRGCDQVAPRGAAQGRALSEQILDILRRRSKGRRRPWRETHAIDPSLVAAFSAAAATITEANYAVDRGCYKINALLTINTGEIAARLGVPYDAVETKFRCNLANLSRPKKTRRSTRLAGFWRREVAGGVARGVHTHFAIHIPRGMRATLLVLLARWLDDPLDKSWSSKRFDRPNWKARSMSGAWHLCRIYSPADVIDYLSKAPRTPDGDIVARHVRRRLLKKGAREFGVFGVRTTGR